MKKINKKGFTLVELLAVVVILGVLLMIAVPAMSNVIDSSKKKSFLSTAKLAIENVETLASTEKLAGSLFSTGKTSCYVPLKDITLERGDYGTNFGGYVMIDEDGKGTIYYYNDSFYLNAGTIDSGTVESQGNPKTVFSLPTATATESCIWY